MVDVVLSTEDITVLGGPTQINLDLDFGKQGNRGSEIYAGYGKPTISALPTNYQLKDLYINLDPNDLEYSCLYQYVTTVVDDISINEWVVLLRIVGLERSINTPLTFTNGEATYSIPIDNYFPEDILPQISEDNIGIQISFVNDNPVAHSVKSITLTNIQSPPSTNLQIVFVASELISGSWSGLSGIKDAKMVLSLSMNQNA